MGRPSSATSSATASSARTSPPSGIDVDEAEVGERWRIGTVAARGGLGADAVQRLQAVAGPRRPRQLARGYAGSVERERPGAYLRVLQPGVLAAGDPIEVVHRPGHGVTVSYLFRALTREPELLPRLLDVEGLVDEGTAQG